MKPEDRVRKLNLEKSFVSAVVYVRNHENEVELFLRGLAETLRENFEKFEITFVNDYSLDKSVEVIKNVSKELKGMTISIINLSYFQGLEAAMIAGVDLAIGDFVFEFDSPVVDYDFSEVMRIYRQSLKGFDIISASPDTGEKFTSRLFYSLFRKYSKNSLQLNTERFRVLSRRSINRINILSASIPYRKALYYNCGLKTANLKYMPVRSLMVVNNKQQRNERVELAVNSLLLFTNLGIKVALYMSVLMLSTSFYAGIYGLCLYRF